jgi:hypothetical protein
MNIPRTAPSRPRPGHAHDHFWHRAISRRRFVQGSIATAGAITAAALTPAWSVGAAKPSLTAAPKPIPGGFELGGIQFHTFFPGFGSENSTITDFNGKIGFAQVQGTGTGVDEATGAETRLLFDSDMRFMQGVYVGQDGGTRNGTFAFV